MDDYQSACNAVTLQSDKRGFFKNFAETVEEAGGLAWLKKFSKLTSDEQRILACLQDTEVNNKKMHFVFYNLFIFSAD